MSDTTTRPNKASQAKFLPSKAELDEAKSIRAEIESNLTPDPGINPTPDAGPPRKPLFGK